MFAIPCNAQGSNDHRERCRQRGIFDNSVSVSCTSRWPGLKLLVLLWMFTEVGNLMQAKAITTVIGIEGSKASLNCSLASGYVQWRTNASATQTLPHSSLLTFPSVKRNAAGFYSCNGTNSSLYHFRLIVQYAAEVMQAFSSPPTTTKLPIGSTVTLTCVVQGQPSEINMTWYNETDQLVHHNTGVSTGSYTISNARCEDGGKYRCVPVNSVGTKKSHTFHVSFVGATPKVPEGVKFNTSQTTSTSLTVIWKQPLSGCEEIYFYDIKYCEVKTSWRNCLTSRTTKAQPYTLRNLKPFTEYTAYVMAVSINGNKSVWSPNAKPSVYTSRAAPSPPRNLTVPEVSDVPIAVSWLEPVHLHGPKDELEYKILYRCANRSDVDWTVECSNTNHIELKNNLTSLKKYMLKVQASNNAGPSGYSEIVTFTVKHREESDSDTSLSAGVVVGIMIGAIAVVVIIVIAAIFLREIVKCKIPLHGFFDLQDSPSLSPLQRIASIRYDERREPVKVEGFSAHVSWLHADSDYKFSLEFEAVNGVHERSKKLTWDHSQTTENQPKNRYTNVVAYDHSRVVLSLNEGDPHSHYINANYVDGYKAMNCYIAAQGPLANTRADFWRMIWEQNCRVVVMITNIIEKGRHKCAMYWPSKNIKTEVCGPLQVTFLEEECFANYTVRTLEVKPVEKQSHYSQFKYPPRRITTGTNWDPGDDEVKPMIVKQYHFTSWPDHGAPDYCFPVLNFIVKSTAANRNNSGPIVVHCSAGVGRSGAYIVIDSMMRRIHDIGDVDIFGFLAHIRQQRNHLVQEECQYIFVHDALVQYVMCEFNLFIKKEDFKQHLDDLRTNKTPDSNTTGMDIKFGKLKNMKIESYKCKQAGRACNVHKNRNQKYVPVDSTRVKLYPRPGEEGSDYISASYLDGFWRREAYIATQHPLESTTEDFWRMIWQENTRSIVMLLSRSEWEQGGFHRYLPPIYDTQRFGSYEVTVEAESTRGDVITKEIKMIKVEDPSECRHIRHFHYLHWDRDGLPWSGQTVLQLINKTEEWQMEVKEKAKKFEMIGPIVVHCSTGTGRTGVYCVLHTIWHQLKRENTVSIYQTVQLCMQQRPHSIETQKQYEFIYDTIMEFIEADCSLYLV